MPRDREWDAIFQYAIREETGFGPWVAQRWYEEEGVLVRREPHPADARHAYAFEFVDYLRVRTD